jgi:hypothetical protein
MLTYLHIRMRNLRLSKSRLLARGAGRKHYKYY